MLERIVLAAIITFCVYLFINFGGNSSNAPSFDAKQEAKPGFISRIAAFSW
jgi:hypothetical protein